ncbi:MAG: hypothetical protein ABSE98_02290 [Acidimicrobiales bacterium]
MLLQVAHFGRTIALQRIALRTKAWSSVATSQLAGNAISLVVPGGAAFGSATQFRMLATSGNDTATAVGGLTAFSLLGIGGLLALPIFVLPAIILGAPIDKSLEHAALLGISAFVLFAGFGAIVLVMTVTGLADRLVFERHRIRDALGRNWKATMLLSSGRLVFDFGTLLATTRATGGGWQTGGRSRTGSGVIQLRQDWRPACRESVANRWQTAERFSTRTACAPIGRHGTPNRRVGRPRHHHCCTACLHCTRDVAQAGHGHARKRPPCMRGHGNRSARTGCRSGTRTPS